MSNSDRLMTALAPIFGGGELDVDEALIERIGDSLDTISGDEISGEMTVDSTRSGSSATASWHASSSP